MLVFRGVSPPCSDWFASDLLKSVGGSLAGWILEQVGRGVGD